MSFCVCMFRSSSSIEAAVGAGVLRARVARAAGTGVLLSRTTIVPARAFGLGSGFCRCEGPGIVVIMQPWA